MSVYKILLFVLLLLLLLLSTTADRAVGNSDKASETVIRPTQIQ